MPKLDSKYSKQENFRGCFIRKHTVDYSRLQASQIQQYIKISVGDQVGWLEQHTSLNVIDNPKSMKGKNQIIA